MYNDNRSLLLYSSMLCSLKKGINAQPWIMTPNKALQKRIGQPGAIC